MSDLSNLLGDVYGDHSPDAAPVRRELSADERAPEWSADSHLDKAFAGWVPGEPPTSSNADLTAALSAALASPAPAPAPVPTPEVVPMPSLAQTLSEEMPAPAWTSEPVSVPVAAVAAPGVTAFWQPGDDDIFPMARGGRKGKRK